MNSSLKIAPCSYEAAKFAVENFHYSKRMPAGKLVKFGVWENERYIGCVLFGRGANNNACKYFGLKTTECCELVRIALTKHEASVTKIISISLRLLKRINPGLMLVFSYADKTNRNHDGKIYIAGNWKQHGERWTNKGAYYIIQGSKIHGRSARSKYGSESRFPSGWSDCEPQMKYLFSYALEKRLKPKSTASTFHAEEGGAVPTQTHQ